MSKKNNIVRCAMHQASGRPRIDNISMDFNANQTNITFYTVQTTYFQDMANMTFILPCPALQGLPHQPAHVW